MARIRGATQNKVQVPAEPGRPRPGAAPAPFGPQLRTARIGLVRGQLDSLLSDLDALGARLADERSLGNLKAYKEQVRSFLSLVQQAALNVQTETDWDYRTWEQRSMTLVRRVDEELDQLARMVLDQEQDRLAILARVGEIKGMLLDLRL